MKGQNSLRVGSALGSTRGMGPGEGLGRSGCSEEFAVCLTGEEEPLKNVVVVLVPSHFRDVKTETQRGKVTGFSSIRSSGTACDYGLCWGPLDPS